MTGIRWLGVVLFAAWGLAMACLPAQSMPVHLPTGLPLVAQHWHVGNGLPQNSIGEVLLARNGFLWVGTFGGLCRFDGSSWRTFDTSVAPGLGGNRVLALHEDPDGTLWIGTERGGVARYRDGAFTQLPGWPGPWVGAILRLQDGRLLAASGSDVQEVALDRPPQPVHHTPLPGVRQLVEAGGRVFAVGARGLHVLEENGWRQLVNHSLNDAALAPDGALYLGGVHGLLVWRHGMLESASGGPTRVVHSVCATRSGAVWYASYRELGCWFRGEPERSFIVPIDGTIRTLVEDDSGAIWAGFLGGGLVRLQPAEVRLLGSAQGLRGGGQNSVVADAAGGVFVGTYAGLFHGREGRFTPVPEVGEVPVAAMLREADGNLWLGLETGIGRLRDGVFTRDGGVAPAGLGIIRALARVDGEIWAGTSAGTFVHRNGALVPLSLHPAIAEDVNLIAHGHDGTIWVASPEAVVHLSPQRTVLGVWQSGVDLPTGEVRAVLPMANGRTWLGIYGGGFVALDAGVHRPRFCVDSRHGLFDHAVCAVVPSGDHWVVGGNRGTYLVAPAELDALADGRSTSIACRPLAGPLDMVAETNGGIQPSGCVVDGAVYLCGVDPLLQVDPQNLAGAVPAPSCYVDTLLVGEAAIAPRGTVDLAAGERTFVFRLGACEFDRPRQVRFRWRLLPRDAEWTLPGYGREAQFVLTEPGEYQFEAEAMTVDNRPSDRPVRVVLRVPPLWHELGAVQVGGGMLLLACGWLVFRFGSARARSREQRLERLVGERTSALRHARENLELRVAQRTSALQCALEQIETNHEQKRRMERELDQLRRMESLGQLAGGIAHDFNNLLTIVLGNAAMLEADLADRPDAGELALRIREAGERGRRMTRHLLAVASRQPVAAGVVDLNQLVLGMRAMLQQLLGPRIHLDVQSAAAPARVRGAASQIEQVLINLAVNARDAMPRGGSFTVTLETQAGRVLMVVADTGVGMSQTVRERAFEPFFTTKDKSRGTGLGLATVYGITKQMHGEVELESAAGRGTLFRFRWPMVLDPVAEPTVVIPNAPATAAWSVLLVEDESDVRQVLRRQLERAGCRVVEAASGEAAVAQLAAAGEAFDLVVSDVQMPGLMGVPFVEALRARRPGLPIVFLSGNATVGPMVGELEALSLVVLGKPVVEAELLQAMAHAVRVAGAGLRLRAPAVAAPG